MEDTDFLEQEDRYAASFSFGDFRTKTAQKRFDVLPVDVRAGRVCEDCFQCPLMGALHTQMVPHHGTERNEGGFWADSQFKCNALVCS